MASRPQPYRTAQCKVCGNLVPEANLPEHLAADARLLQIIRATHPDWEPEDCERHLQSLNGYQFEK